MDFLEAKEKMEKLAGKDYYSMTYEVKVHTDRTLIEQECSFYTKDSGRVLSGKTWEEALNKMDCCLSGKTYPSPDLNEAPHNV